jgi:hypothetical protein
MQARNNARAVVFGSLDMLSDDLFALSNGSNAAFARSLGEPVLCCGQRVRIFRFHSVEDLTCGLIVLFGVAFRSCSAVDVRRYCKPPRCKL